MLLLIGATPEGRTDLVGFQVGMWESVQSWHEPLIALKAHGLIPTRTHRRWWRPGPLEGAQGGLPGDAASVLHDAQDNQRGEQDAKVHPACSQTDEGEVTNTPA